MKQKIVKSFAKNKPIYTIEFVVNPVYKILGKAYFF